MKQIHVTYTRTCLNNTEHSISFIGVVKDPEDVFFKVHSNDQFIIKSHAKDSVAEDEIKKRIKDIAVISIIKQRPFRSW